MSGRSHGSGKSHGRGRSQREWQGSGRSHGRGRKSTGVAGKSATKALAVTAELL